MIQVDLASLPSGLTMRTQPGFSRSGVGASYRSDKRPLVARFCYLCQAPATQTDNRDELRRVNLASVLNPFNPALLNQKSTNKTPFLLLVLVPKRRDISENCCSENCCTGH